jgi:hypothetical protein
VVGLIVANPDVYSVFNKTSTFPCLAVEITEGIALFKLCIMAAVEENDDFLAVSLPASLVRAN